MRKTSIILSLILVMILATPAFASVTLDINGRAYEPSSEIYLEDGVTLVPLDVIGDVLGCEAAVGEDIRLKENDNTLQMAVDKTTAMVNDAAQTMPKAPRIIEGKIYVPLRFVLESSGAQVNWNGETRQVSIIYNEMRNGMTAEEIMAKSSAAMNAANQYKMLADMQSTIGVKADGPEAEAVNISMDMKGTVEAWMQLEPVAMYLKQNMTMDIPNAPIPGLQAVETQMVMNQDGLFTTMPDIGWVKMDLGDLNIDELMQQYMTQDPTAALQQMRDLGTIVSFGQDQEKSGKKYWVVHAVMNGNIMESDYFSKFTQQMPALMEGIDIQQLLENLDVDLVYDTWIDQETFYSDYMNMSGDMKFDMNLPATGESPAGVMEMAMNIQASYTMSDYGKEFTVPDVTGARNFEEVLAEQAAKLQETLESGE